MTLRKLSRPGALFLLIYLFLIKYLKIDHDLENAKFGILSKETSSARATNEIQDAVASPEISKMNYNSTCIFVLSTPGSGSSTMVEVLSHCMGKTEEKLESSCAISGENWGAFQDLAGFSSNMKRTDRQPRNDAHNEAAWRKIYSDFAQVHNKELELVHSILNPSGLSCWGFKEIRYGRKNLGNFEQDIDYLASLCANPKIIFHSRNITKEVESEVMTAVSDEERAISYAQQECFDTYTGMKTTPSSNFAKCKGPSKVPVFRHHLEDYISQNDVFISLWEDYLKCTEPIPGGSVKLSGKTK